MRFPGGFEGVFESSRKTTRKVRAVEVPMEGSKQKNSLGAPKWAIHVKTLLNGLCKLIEGTFYPFELGLSDLKDGQVKSS